MKAGAHRPDPYLSAGIALAIVLFLLYVYPGFLSPVVEHFDGTCRTIELGASADDVRIDAKTGVAYLSYYDRVQPDGESQGRRHGTVMLVDLNAAEPRVRAALTTEPPGFVPEGMSLYEPENGAKRLFVVNRAGFGANTVEIFEQSATGAFVPVETISDALLWSPSAIVAVGPRQFYVTNDAGFRPGDASKPERRIAKRLRGSRSTVLYFDGERMREVADRLDRANGITISPAGDVVYVSEGGARHLRVFDRDASSGDLSSRETISLGSAPARLTIDAQGSIWIGAYPRVRQTLRTLSDPAARAPTQVLKFTPGAPVESQVQEVYANGGEEISAGSVAAAHGQLLVIGSLTDRKLLLCTRAGSPREAPGQASPAAMGGPEKET